MMFFQDPSMLEFQTRLQQQINQNNLKTLFNVSSIPKSTQLKQVIDTVPSESAGQGRSGYNEKSKTKNLIPLKIKDTMLSITMVMVKRIYPLIFLF